MLGLSWWLAAVAAAWQAPGAADPLPSRMPEASPRTLSFDIRARLEADDRGRLHLIRASERVTWRNRGAEPAREILWHVYNNAWASPDSLWLTEARLHGDTAEPREWGGTEILAVRLPGRGESPPVEIAWEWVAPATAPRDRTVLRTPLPEPVPPGGEVTLEVDFLTDLPPAFRRSGYGSGGYVHAVQWYPKPGVWEERDGVWTWNCEPYHYLTEFYSDYGDYRVELTLPELYRGPEGDRFVATGSKEGGPAENGDGTLTWVLRARDVHDFAWTGDPEARLRSLRFDPEALGLRDPAEEAAVAAALGRPVEEVRPSASWEIEMHLLLQPEHEAYEERYLQALARSIYWFGLWYGRYPYPTISLVDPAHDARATGGMEYPRLITGGARLYRPPRSFSPEGVTVHEFGHQYWYGLVGNDEFRHAWMDEGFTTFSTNRVLARAWPEPPLDTWEVLGTARYGRLPGRLPRVEEGDVRGILLQERLVLGRIGTWQGGDFALRPGSGLLPVLAAWPGVSAIPEVARDPVWHQRSAHAYDFSDPVARPTWELLGSSARRLNAYLRPAMTLETIARLCGETRWRRLIRAWHEEQRFHHPRPADFEAHLRSYGAGAALEGAEGRVEVDWASFWDQAYRGNGRLDFALHRIEQTPLAAAEEGAEPGAWEVVVEVRRLGAFRTPVELDLHWEDGSVERHVWDGRDSWWRLRIPASPRRLVEAVVDPERRYLLDRNRLNNTRRVEPELQRARAFGLRAWIWAAQLIHWFGGVG